MLIIIQNLKHKYPMRDVNLCVMKQVKTFNSLEEWVDPFQITFDKQCISYGSRAYFLEKRSDWLKTQLNIPMLVAVSNIRKSYDCKRDIFEGNALEGHIYEKITIVSIISCTSEVNRPISGIEKWIRLQYRKFHVWKHWLINRIEKWIFFI